MAKTPISAPDKKLFYSRQDPLDPRLGDLVKVGTTKEVHQNSWFIFGYPDDEGIRLNGGRPGAKLAPEAIRRALYRMTPHFTHLNQSPIYDLGNLDIEQLSLNQRHQCGRELAQDILQKNGRWLALGGGHDYAYCDIWGFLTTQQGHRPLVINFDSHLDVRPTQDSANSGTAFRRLIDEFKSFDLVEIGVQAQCNAQAHLQWFQEHGGHLLSLDQIVKSSSSPQETICKFLTPHLTPRRPTFVSVDLDAFSSAYAPGCSQSWATGLNPNDALAVFDFISTRAQVHGIGLYEVSPPLDHDDQTSRLAALIAHRFIYPPQRETNE